MTNNYNKNKIMIKKTKFIDCKLTNEYYYLNKFYFYINYLKFFSFIIYNYSLY